MRRPRTSPLLAWYALAAVLAVFTYFYGLDSLHIPKNGDEYPYAHITRLTAAGGEWLPLRSELAEMRNTKPPLLFWQGIASTRWAAEWTLANLRYPSVLYTLLTAALAGLLAARLSRRPETGLLAGVAFLAFLSTYRYGRPFLTDPPEVFWLFAPFCLLLYFSPASFRSRLAVPALVGIATGIGLLYKSFALVVPVGLGLAWWYLHAREYRWAEFLARDAWRVALAGALALAVFGLWFVVDPDPGAIWREFVVQENVGKLGAGGNYIGKLLWGGSSIWSLALGYPLNAGVLAPPVLGLAFVLWRGRREMTDGEKLLGIWIVVLFLVFAAPSQRSSRYLLPAMPALAVLLALYWNRIARGLFVASLAFTLAAAALAAYFSLQLQPLAGSEPRSWAYWALLVLAAAVAAGGIAVRRFTRAAAPVAAVAAFLVFAATMRTLDGAPGQYPLEARERARGASVGVPYNWNAKFERYRFLLPGADIAGYRDDRGTPLAELRDRYPVLAVQVPVSGKPPCDDCRVIGSRLDLRSRPSSEVSREAILGGAIDGLLVREYLIEARGASAAALRGGAAAPPR
jgi:4-amino-4-deoxy-L-arabinose transferase-like glycosyltransferase